MLIISGRFKVLEAFNFKPNYFTVKTPTYFKCKPPYEGLKNRAAKSRRLTTHSDRNKI